MIWFRLPFSKDIYTTDGRTAGVGVQFISFNEAKKIGFPGNIIKINENDLDEKIPLTKAESKISESKEDYINKIHRVIDFVKSEDLEKLVISRRIPLPFNQIDLKSSFLNLCKVYRNSFCYLFLQEDQCWIGAFSELLGKFNRITGEFTTMSLAGTLPVNEDWSEKEILEQKPVSQFIYSTLKNFSDSIIQSDTYDHISGNLKHLRTDFSCKIDEIRLESLIAQLHPTPAVCGIPKDKCLAAIRNFENHEREFYSGYSKIETGEMIYYFVTLRCAKITDSHIEIFAGGGITAGSIPEKEWQETEQKASAILKNIVIS